MMTRKFHRLRRALGTVLLAILIGLPFLQINNESAFRFDVPTLRLLFFGNAIGMADFFIVLIAVIFLTFFFLFITTVFGRIWCGWLCPQTVILDIMSSVEKASQGRYTARLLSLAAAILFSGVIAFSVIGYFVSPYELPHVLQNGGISARIVGGSLSVLAVIFFLDLTVLQRKFCATICPYAGLQSVLFDDRTLLVAFDDNRVKECMHCNACVNICPVNIDIRKGSQRACIHCAECVDACSDRMAMQGEKSLINYVLGPSQDRALGFRFNPLITGIITVVVFSFLLFLSASRMPFDVNVHLKHPGTSPVHRDGSITNIYEVSVRNVGALDQELVVSATVSSGSVKVVPEVILLKKNENFARVPVAVTLTGLAPDLQLTVKVTLTLTSKQDKGSLSKPIYFMTGKRKV